MKSSFPSFSFLLKNCEQLDYKVKMVDIHKRTKKLLFVHEILFNSDILKERKSNGIIRTYPFKSTTSSIYLPSLPALSLYDKYFVYSLCFYLNSTKKKGDIFPRSNLLINSLYTYVS